MEIIEVSQADLAEIEGDRHRTFKAISTPLTADVILNDIQTYDRRRVIVICNTVSQAQGLFRDLTELNRGELLNITLLHSRFLPEHRAAKEAEIKANFSKNWQPDGMCYVLIATQVIEVGIDITCEVMHVELCPMNSLLQRAGRCARFPGEQGEVCVYWQIEVNPNQVELAERDFDPEVEEQKKSFLPYDKELCELTWQVLEDHTKSEQVNQKLGFSQEQEWINRVHQQDDALQDKRRQNNQMNFEEQYNAAVFRGCRSAASELIRLVDSRSVFVWEDTAWVDLDSETIDPKQLIPFSLPVSALCKVWQDVKNLGDKIDWVFKSIEEPEGRKGETYSRPVCKVITNRNEIISTVRILVNPKYVHYSKDVGLAISLEKPEANFNSPNRKQKCPTNEYKYFMDTYVGHLGCMWACWRDSFTNPVTKITYVSVRDELLQAGGRFIKLKIFSQVNEDDAKVLFEYLVFFAVLIHDLGKLQIKWQDVMRKWQEESYRNYGGKNPRSHLLAHTDSDPENKAQQKALKEYESKNRRPPHAVESAFIGRDILNQSLVPLLRDYFNAEDEQIQYIRDTVVMAAGRHHSAWAKGDKLPSKIKLHPQAQAVISKSWDSLARFLPKTLPLQKANLRKLEYITQSDFDLNRFEKDQTEYLQLYWLVVRALRLCDTRAVQLRKTPLPGRE
jgi:CRISPR-associated endonuclease/helicase Cas3